MDRNAIIRTFLSSGTQISKDAFEVLNSKPEILDSLLTMQKEYLPPVITIEFLQTIHTQPTIQKNISTSDTTQILNYRYEILRNIILENAQLRNLISINKITNKTKDFSVIGIVLAKDTAVTLEDTTSQAEFLFPEEHFTDIVEDEVIGLICEQKNGRNVVKNVIYPDFPLKKENTKTVSAKKCVFISDINLPGVQMHYERLIAWLKDQKDLVIFFTGGTSGSQITQAFNNIHPTYFYSEGQIKNSPTHIRIENIDILLTQGSFLQYYSKRWDTETLATIVNLLKKRNLNPVITSENYNNSFLLENTPDIIAIVGTKAATSFNYKGTTIVTTGDFQKEPIYWVINLQTRETFKIDLS